MLKRELDFLKCIKDNERITEAELMSEYPDYQSILYYVNDFVRIDDLNNKEYVNNMDEYNARKYVLKNLKESDIEPQYNYDPQKIYYSLSHSGFQFFEDRAKKFWSFILPYGITTIIAILSLIAQLTN